MKKILLSLLVVSLLALPLSAMAMEKMSGNDMGDVTGQAGVTIAFGSTTTTSIDFSEVSWGDPDGMGTGTNASCAGWLVIDGDISIQQVISCGQTLKLDIATACAGDYTICTAGAIIPSGTTFIAVGLPSIKTSINTPDTLYVGLGESSGSIAGTLGILNLKNLDVSQGTPSALYIYAH